jgi:hypothetical protein
VPSPPRRVAVFSIELNDLSNQPVTPALPSRLQSLTAALREQLTTACGYSVVPIDSVAEASAQATAGYFYAHPEVALQVTPPARADWIVIPRLNRASTWVADLQAHVVRVSDTAIVSNRIVELKGLELTPDLAARLTERGAAWMADQVSQVIEHALSNQTAVPRRCPP